MCHGDGTGQHPARQNYDLEMLSRLIVSAMPDDQTDALAAIWEQSKAEAAQQNSDIDSLRNRAVAMLSVGTLVGGLFGSRLPHAHISKLNEARRLPQRADSAKPPWPPQ
jgi:predicted GTPase